MFLRLLAVIAVVAGAALEARADASPPLPGFTQADDGIPKGAGFSERVQIAGEPASELRYDSRAVFETAAVPMNVRTVYVDAVVSPRYCPLAYVRGTGKLAREYGEVAKDGIYWEPRYSRYPVEACEFGAVGDAHFSNGGGYATVRSAGGSTLTTTNTGALVVGMSITNVNYASLGAAAMPAGTMITHIEANSSITVSNDVPAGRDLAVVGWWDLNPTTVAGTDDTRALQSAIDYALQNRLPDVRLGGGLYKFSDTLHLGYGETYSTVRLLGGERAQFDRSLGGIGLVFVASDRPAINIQGGRSDGLKGLAIYGPNLNYVNWAQWWNNSLSPNEADWIAPNLTHGGTESGGLQPHCPLAGITIDAYSGNPPLDACPLVSYPKWTGAASQYGKDLSSDTTFDEVSVRGFAVDYAVGLNTNDNGDFTRIRGGEFGSSVYGVSISNTQSRNVEVRNISSAGMFTMLTNSRFGEQTGEWNGPVDNIATGGVYQMFDFNALAFAGPLTIRNLYCENCVRIGRLSGQSSFNAAVIFDGGEINLSEALHGQIPASFITAGINQSITFRGTEFNTNQRLSTLIQGGNSVAFRCEGCMFATTMRNPGGPAVQASMNYFGGINIGAPKFNTAGVDWSTFEASTGSYFTASSGGIASEMLDEKAQAGAMLRLQTTQASKLFVDSQNKQWRLQIPSPNLLVMTNASFVPDYGRPSWSKDVMTFTMTASEHAVVLNFGPGWTLYHVNTGTNFIVTAVAAPDQYGNYPVATQQQNNLTIEPKSGAYASNMLLDTALSGYVVLIPPALSLPGQIHYGTFTAGSAEVTNVSQGDGYGGSVNCCYAPGDPLYPPEFNDSYAPWPIAPRSRIAISRIAPGSPASMSLTGAASVSGRFPIFPVPIN